MDSQVWRHPCSKVEFLRPKTETWTYVSLWNHFLSLSPAWKVFFFFEQFFSVDMLILVAFIHVFSFVSVVNWCTFNQFLLVSHTFLLKKSDNMPEIWVRCIRFLWWGKQHTNEQRRIRVENERLFSKPSTAGDASFSYNEVNVTWTEKPSVKFYWREAFFHKYQTGTLALVFWVRTTCNLM